MTVTIVAACYAIVAACAFTLGWGWARSKTENECFIAATLARGDAYARGFQRGLEIAEQTR